MAMKRKISDWVWLAFLVLQLLGLSLLGSPGCQREEPYNPWGDDTTFSLEVEGGIVYDSAEVVLVFRHGGGDTFLIHKIESEFDFETGDVTSFQIVSLKGECRFRIPAEYIKVKEAHKGTFVILLTDISKGRRGAYRLEAQYDAVPWRPAAD